MNTTTLRTSLGQYVCAEGGGGRELVANRLEAGPWETFEVAPSPEGASWVSLRAHNGQYVCAELNGTVMANRVDVGPWESWTPVSLGDGRWAFQSWHGKFLCAELGGGGAVNATRREVGLWETFQATLGVTHDGPSRETWGDNTRPLATFGMGGFIDSSELPGQPAEKQDAWIARWVNEGYTHVQFAIVNGDTSRGRRAYDGFANPDVLRPVLEKLAHAKLIPMLVMFQGARSSWDLLCTPSVRGYYNAEGREQFGYSNEWAAANLTFWCQAVMGLWGGVSEGPPPYFVLGYESDEGFYDIANRDDRGMVEKYGFAAYRDVWAAIAARSGLWVAIHYLTDRAWPADGQGGRDWGGPKYYQDTAFSLVLIQTAADDDRPQQEQVAAVAAFKQQLASVANRYGQRLLACGGEYGQEGGNEARAKDTGRKMEAGGSDGKCYG